MSGPPARGRAGWLRAEGTGGAEGEAGGGVYGTSQGSGGSPTDREGGRLAFRAVPPAGLCGAGAVLLSPALQGMKPGSVGASLCPGFSMSSAACTLWGTRYSMGVVVEVERFSPSRGALCRSRLFSGSSDSLYFSGLPWKVSFYILDGF